MVDVNSIHAILNGIDRYNPEHLPLLESYVEEQCVSGSYDSDANLCVLKLYQFNPLQTNVRVVALILCKAVMRLPATDFTLCLYLLTEKLHSDPLISKIITMGQLLETCQFKEFWTKAYGKSEKGEQDSFQELVKTIQNFDVAIRDYAAHIFSITYQKISRELFLQVLHIDVKKQPKLLQKYAEIHGWKLSDDVVEFPVRQENQKKPKNIVDKLDLSALNRLMANCAQ
eukprot:Sdes_comp17735_c0_seq1m7000